MIYDIFVKMQLGCHPVTVVQYSTHLHTKNTQNDTKQTIHRTTQKCLEDCWSCPVFASYTQKGE